MFIYLNYSLKHAYMQLYTLIDNKCIIGYNSDMEYEHKQIKKRITELPKGYIVKKNIKGKDYYYHRFVDNGKRKEKYIPFDELEDFRKQVEERKDLLKQLHKSDNNSYFVQEPRFKYFKCSIILDDLLKDYTSSVVGFKKRDCFKVLNDYLHAQNDNKVLILYGLRRTGKTTLIKQAILDMSEEDLKKTAFIQCNSNNDLAMLNYDLMLLRDNGYKYIFIDEITLLNDFIDGSSVLPDIFVSTGMRIVLSGTDSLGFVLSQDSQLYDRCVMLHTTFIKYKEFEDVLKIKGIDEFIRHGGTMSVSGKNYNEVSTFASIDSTNEYVNSSIANNIQHSLKYYDNSNHFRALKDLYDNDELTNVINRVIEDINHRFTLEVLTKTFKSNDLALSARNLRNDKHHPDDTLDRIDTKKVTDRLIELLEIKNKDDQRVTLSDEHCLQIKQYLDLLDLTVDIDIRDIDTVRTNIQTLICQPGLRYSQVDALIDSLFVDDYFLSLPIEKTEYILSRIKSEVMGRIMEDIVLLETKLANKDKQVFKLQFVIGEIDMVVFDRNKLECQLYEIKHSSVVDSHQYRYLIDESKMDKIRHRFGEITSKAVIYNGKTTKADDIDYLNVEKYLHEIWK